MTSKSYTSRTTLWDDQDPAGASAPQARGAWRAPSAVLSGDRSARRIASEVSAVSPDVDDAELRGPVPRRTKFASARTPWWRPRSTFGRVLLGMAAFLVLGSVVVLGIIVHRFLDRDPHFRIPGISSIQSSGLSEVNRTEVLPVFGEDIGRNIFFVPLSERRKQLEAIPWVQKATVMRFLPNRLSVSIVERTPVAFVREGDRVELADADGVILSMPPVMMAQHHYSFPVITGINAKDPIADRRARMAVYQRFIAELDQNNQHLTQQVSEIDLSDPEDLRATMPEQGADILAHFGEDQFLHRLQIYKAHIAEWRQRYPRLIGVDLRYNGEIPLEMSNDAASTTSIPFGGVRGDSKSTTSVGGTSGTTGNANSSIGSSVTAAPKTATNKTNAAARKALEAKRKASKLKASRLKAARTARGKGILHPAVRDTNRPSSQLKQGQ